VCLWFGGTVRFGSKADVSVGCNPHRFQVVLVYFVGDTFVNYWSPMKGLEPKVEGVRVGTFSNNKRIAIWQGGESLKVVLWGLGLQIFGKLRERRTTRTKLLYGPCACLCWRGIEPMTRCDAHDDRDR